MNTTEITPIESESNLAHPGNRPAVVTPLDEHMGLDIARALHKRGITVYGIDSDPHAVGRHSNACKFVLAPEIKTNAQAYLRFLVDFSLKLRCKPVLFPLSDEHVLLISRNRDLILKYYELVMPSPETIEALATKVGLIDVAHELHIPAPLTLFPHSLQEVESVSRTLQYPVIIKPGESPQWHDPRIVRQLRRGLLAGRAKVVVCHNPSELQDYYRKLAALNPELVIQEVIPGEDNRLFYTSFYLDRQSRPLGIFAGRKERVMPVGFGSASFVHSYYDPELIETGLRVLQGTQYQGLGGVELKKDPRDEIYKLIEVNTRFGMWDGLGEKCGVDLAYIAYCDTLGIPVEPATSFCTNIIWIDWQRDLRAAIQYWRQGKLTWREWLSSLHGKKMWAIYNRSDPLPGIFFTFRLMGIFLNRVLHH
ncbi:MAG: hypothetical protein WHV66_02745 [Anaerolineales bacterium]